MTRLDQALALARAGLRVCLTHSVDGDGACSCGKAECAARGKHPILPRWQKVSTDDEQVLRDQFNSLRVADPNLSIALGEQSDGRYLVSIDEDDADRMSELVAKHGELPPTMSGASPRGAHMFYALPVDTPRGRVKNITGVGDKPGVDLKAEGGQVVVYGRNAGGEYAGFDPTVPVTDLPPAWVLRILAPVKPPKDAHEYTPQTLREDARAKSRYRKYLDAAVIGECRLLARTVEGQRNTAAYRVAFSLFSLANGMHLPAAWGHVRDEVTSAAIATGLSKAEARAAVASAEKGVTESGATRMPREVAPLSPLPPGVFYTSREPGFYPDADHVEEPGEPPAPEPPAEPWGSGARGASGGGTVYEQHNGKIAPTAENVARFLEGDPGWGGGPMLDIFTRFFHWPHPLPAPLQAIHRYHRNLTAVDYSVVQSACLAAGIVVGANVAEGGVYLAGSRNPYDSLVRYTDELPAWDGVARLETWLTRYLGCDDTSYYRVTGRAFLCGAMGRAVSPGGVFDLVPVMRGRQEAGKNYAIQILFGERAAVLGKWDPDKPTTKKLACERWVLHDDEFRARRERELDSLKSWVSLTTETYLPKYSNTLEVCLRRAVLICSTNAEQFLSDPTGDRRFYPWAIGEQIDHLALERDREQLLAEALHEVRTKGAETWRQDLKCVRESHQEHAEGARTDDLIGGSLLSLAARGKWQGMLAASDLAAALGVGPERADTSFAQRLGVAVKLIGGHAVRRQVNGTRIQFYAPPENT